MTTNADTITEKIADRPHASVDRSFAYCVKCGVSVTLAPGASGCPRCHFDTVVTKASTTCVDHWHCDPALAAHDCTRVDRAEPCPRCGAVLHAYLRGPGDDHCSICGSDDEYDGLHTLATGT